MGKTVTFLVSTNSEGSTLKETFSFGELGIEDDIDDNDEKKIIDACFKDWVWNNISYSYIIEKD
ncbi:hypothetical protein AB3Z07_13835 [Metabacillus halosaccharovorans]|uniref:DUF7167 family protein n=1 Tax=Metabacillus halosaccharovorans TaxID=930124 RepID=UPI0034CDA321